MDLPQVVQAEKNVHEFFFGKTNSAWYQDVLLMSDVHFDSIKCDKQLLKKHMTEAKEKNALVMIFGDLFDVMQGAKDRRGSKHAMDVEIIREMQETGKEYYEVAVDQAIRFFLPFKDNMAFISYGNHETAINRHNEFDVMRKFAAALDMQIGGYEGYIKFKMQYGSTKKSTSGKVLKYHHGYGGAKRSKGMLDSQLFAFAYPSADICVRGHNHYKFLDTNVSEVLTSSNTIYKRKQYYVNLGTYKKKDDSMGWEVEKGFYNPALGGWWMRISETKNRKESNGRYKLTLHEAD